MEWADVTVPAVSLRGRRGHGIEVQVRARTKPYEGFDFALATVTTASDGTEDRHDNVLLGISELESFADLLLHALAFPRIDRTISVFDDEATLQVKQAEPGKWNVRFGPVHVPPAGATWKNFPDLRFQVDRGDIEHALSAFQDLANRLAD